MDGSHPRSPRDRILDAATRLLSEQGRDGVTTRAVCAEAGVQAQTIYRHFGDMRTLLETVAAEGFHRYLHAKDARELGDDPVEDLRVGWDLHMDFALANPHIYTLMYGERRARPDHSLEVYGVLHRVVERVAASGRLTVPVDVAAAMVYATGIGVAMTLITTDSADLPAAGVLSARTRDAVLGAVTVDAATASPEDTARHAIALSALVRDDPAGLTEAEVALLRQWLSVIGTRG